MIILIAQVRSQNGIFWGGNGFVMIKKRKRSSQYEELCLPLNLSENKKKGLHGVKTWFHTQTQTQDILLHQSDVWVGQSKLFKYFLLSKLLN